METTKEEVKEILSKKYPQYPGFIEHTLIAEMCIYFADRQYTSQKETIERLRHFVQTFIEGVDICAILIDQDDESQFGDMFYDSAKQLLSTTEPINQ